MAQRVEHTIGVRLQGLSIRQGAYGGLELVGHRRELPANRLHADEKSTVVHDRHSAIATNRRTMDFRQTANRLLTVCLSQGGRRTLTLNRFQWIADFRCARAQAVE